MIIVGADHRFIDDAGTTRVVEEFSLLGESTSLSRNR